MEGPSLYLAAEQLAPFLRQTIQQVEGNTKVGKERLLKQEVLDIFSWGKHLVFQFPHFAMRIHFMLFGSFEAIVKKVKVTGDYPTKNRAPRLSLYFDNGSIQFYSCSIKFIESSCAKDTYDFSTDTMSSKWNQGQALRRVIAHPNAEIGDVLLDQNIFSGVGNIIRNEVLFMMKISPERLVKTISKYKLSEIIKTIRRYVFQFYEWRKSFVLRKHYQIYRRKVCPQCKLAVVKKQTGARNRISYICSHCQM